MRRKKNKVVHVESPSCDVSKKLTVSVENGLEVSAGHVEKGLEAGAGHVETVSSLSAKNNREKEPNFQGGVSSCGGKEVLVKQRTWTQVARFAQKGHDRAKADAAGAVKRTFMEIDDWELPNKRRLVAHDS